ncbi:hypothetical protein [Amycolatopsis orientalis]|nr:hypothetical protein [Amycolatopsis orientalis]
MDIVDPFTDTLAEGGYVQVAATGEILEDASSFVIKFREDEWAGG